jgi:ComF family protein
VKSGLAVENATVTFVPLHKDRKKTRGYDQAEKLAQVVAKKLSLPLEETLTCVGKKEKQKELTLSERRKNVSGVYCVIEKKNVQDKTYLLVDDIMTTGATGSACARVLKNAGANKVIFLTAVSLDERK